jgi:hypothetical protein
MVKVAACSFLNLPTGAAHSAARSGRAPTILQVFRRNTHGEGAEADAVAADLAVSVGAARRAPDRRMRILQWLGLHAPRRAHLPVLPVGAVVLLGPRTHDVMERLAPHLARLVRIDAEALELRASRRAPRPELDATVGEQVEHGDRLRGADRMVVRLREQPHAVADADVLGAGRDRAVEDLRV